jgi:hypothetical protein
MISKGFTALLVLLVVSVRADDIAAAFAPELEGDVLAAQDNDYLSAVRPERCEVAAGENTPYSFGLLIPVSSPSANSPTIIWLSHSNLSPWRGADLLCCIMLL